MIAAWKNGLREDGGAGLRVRAEERIVCSE